MDWAGFHPDIIYRCGNEIIAQQRWQRDEDTHDCGGWAGSCCSAWPPQGQGERRTRSPAGRTVFLQAYFFIFSFFKKKFTEIYFWFQVLQFYTPTARQEGGRDLYVNKKKFAQRSMEGACRPPAGRQAPYRPTSWRQGACRPIGGAAGSLLKYKTPPLPSTPSFSAHEIQRGERERGGVRKVIPPAKPYRILDPKKNLVYFLRS